MGEYNVQGVIRLVTKSKYFLFFVKSFRNSTNPSLERRNFYAFVGNRVCRT